MFLDDTACNLASLNLMKFRREDGEFDTRGVQGGVSHLITAQEILVDNASYPTPAIERNSHDFRPRLGYANSVCSYGPRAAVRLRRRPWRTAAITALMHGEAYAQSARIASAMGPFQGYAVNAEPRLRVIDKHRSTPT